MIEDRGYLLEYMHIIDLLRCMLDDLHVLYGIGYVILDMINNSMVHD